MRTIIDLPDDQLTRNSKDFPADVLGIRIPY
jgi:hypothetical protein